MPHIAPCVHIGRRSRGLDKRRAPIHAKHQRKDQKRLQRAKPAKGWEPAPLHLPDTFGYTRRSSIYEQHNRAQQVHASKRRRRSETAIGRNYAKMVPGEPAKQPTTHKLKSTP